MSKEYSIDNLRQLVKAQLEETVKEMEHYMLQLRYRELNKALPPNSHVEPGEHEAVQSGVQPHMEPGTDEQFALDPIGNDPIGHAQQPVSSGTGLPMNGLPGPDMCPMCGNEDNVGSCQCLGKSEPFKKSVPVHTGASDHWGKDNPDVVAKAGTIHDAGSVGGAGDRTSDDNQDTVAKADVGSFRTSSQDKTPVDLANKVANLAGKVSNVIQKDGSDVMDGMGPAGSGPDGAGAPGADMAMSEKEVKKAELLKEFGFKKSEHCKKCGNLNKMCKCMAKKSPFAKSAKQEAEHKLKMKKAAESPGDRIEAVDESKGSDHEERLENTKGAGTLPQDKVSERVKSGNDQDKKDSGGEPDPDAVTKKGEEKSSGKDCKLCGGTGKNGKEWVSGMDHIAEPKCKDCNGTGKAKGLFDKGEEKSSGKDCKLCGGTGKNGKEWVSGMDHIAEPKCKDCNGTGKAKGLFDKGEEGSNPSGGKALAEKDSKAGAALDKGTQKAEVKDANGKPETCGKCAAVGSNSKGPGAHAPGCPKMGKAEPLDKGRIHGAPVAAAGKGYGPGHFPEMGGAPAAGASAGLKAPPASMKPNKVSIRPVAKPAPVAPAAASAMKAEMSVPQAKPPKAAVGGMPKAPKAAGMGGLGKNSSAGKALGEKDAHAAAKAEPELSPGKVVSPSQHGPASPVGQVQEGGRSGVRKGLKLPHKGGVMAKGMGMGQQGGSASPGMNAGAPTSGNGLALTQHEKGEHEGERNEFAADKRTASPDKSIAGKNPEPDDYDPKDYSGTVKKYDGGELCTVKGCSGKDKGHEGPHGTAPVKKTFPEMNAPAHVVAKPAPGKPMPSQAVHADRQATFAAHTPVGKPGVYGANKLPAPAAPAAEHPIAGHIASALASAPERPPPLPGVTAGVLKGPSLASKPVRSMAVQNAARPAAKPGIFGGLFGKGEEKLDAWSKGKK